MKKIHQIQKVNFFLFFFGTYDYFIVLSFDYILLFSLLLSTQVYINLNQGKLFSISNMCVYRYIRVSFIILYVFQKKCNPFKVKIMFFKKNMYLKLMKEQINQSQGMQDFIFFI